MGGEIMYELKDLDKWKDTDEKKVYKYFVGAESWIYIELKKGMIAGEHYHKGTAKVKNPEINVLLKGKIK